MNNKLAQRSNIGTEIKLYALRFESKSRQVTAPTVIRVNVHDLADSVCQESLGFDDFEVVAHTVPVEPFYQAVQCFCGRIGVWEVEVGEHAVAPVLCRGQELRKHALEGGALSLPCFQDELNGVGCDKAEWWTLQEATEQAEESRQAVEKYFLAIAEGKCPQCDRKVIQRQVGHCVYGSCGHRLYQGTVNAEFEQQ